MIWIIAGIFVSLLIPYGIFFLKGLLLGSVSLDETSLTFLISGIGKDSIHILDEGDGGFLRLYHQRSGTDVLHEFHPFREEDQIHREIPDLTIAIVID